MEMGLEVPTCAVGDSGRIRDDDPEPAVYGDICKEQSGLADINEHTTTTPDQEGVAAAALVTRDVDAAWIPED